MRVLIFGNGRVGASFARYAAHLGHEASVVTQTMIRHDRDLVAAMVQSADLVAAAIPDDSLAGWRKNWDAELAGKAPPIHFSGALMIAGMRGYHPLYSFPKAPLPPETMGRIVVAREEGAALFSSILPGARNPEFAVRAEDRPYYHALAVLSGNFAAHLWNLTAAGFSARFGFSPEKILGSYLEGVVERFREAPLGSMTGPVARRDCVTVKANLAALDRDPRLKQLYIDFLASAWPDWTEDGEKQG